MRQERSVCLFDGTHSAEFALGAMRSGVWPKGCQRIDSAYITLTTSNLYITHLTSAPQEARL